MGIQGLLPLLGEATERRHLSDYSGQTLAVDAFVLLHRGLCTCAKEVALGLKTIKYAEYAMKSIRMLQHFGITPYVIFDGSNLPSKAHTETGRAQCRADALAKAKTLMATGQESAARDHFLKACDVTPQMAYQLIKLLQRENIQFIVAPYEADAQMCFLEQQGLVDGIITEDSDLIVFGCQTVLFKLDKNTAAVQEIKRERLTRCKQFRLDGFSVSDFRHMAIMSGCDYLPSVPGVGCKTAHRLMRRYRCARKAIQAMRLDAKLVVPRNYDKEFERADFTFQHQIVYDPASQKVCHLTPLPSSGLSTANLIAVGCGLSHEIGHGIAQGLVDPTTKEPMIDIHPDDPAPSTSRLIPSSLSANATQPSDTKDIRNFFKPAVPLAEQRKPLAKVAVNRFKGKVKIEEEKNRPSPKQGFTSRFFGGASTSDRPPSATSVRSASIVLDESEDENDVEIITKQQPESLVLSKQEEDEADAMWARTQAAAGAEELLQEEPSRVLQDAPDLESPPRPTAASEELDSPGGSITSPEVSPLKQQLSPASPLQVHQTKHESEGDELSKLSDDFVFTSPAQTYPDSSTSPPSPQDKRTDQENSQDAPLLKFSPKKRKFSRLDLTSDIDDFSSPKQEAKPPPTKRRRSSPLHKASNSLRQSSGQPFPAQTSVDSDDEETVEAARSDEAAQKVAASLRSRFSFSSTSFSKSTSSSPSLTSISKRRGSVVAKNATTKDPTSRLKRAVNAALSQKQKNCTFNTPTEQSGGDQRPSAKLRRHHASMNTRAPGSSTSLAAPEETEKCTHWRKVDITSSTLASFKR